MTDDLERTLPAALRRLADRAPEGPPDPAPIVHRVARQRRRLVLIPAVAVAVLAVLIAVGVTRFRTPGTTPVRPVAPPVCAPLQTGTPPTWAQAGFQGNSYPPFARSSSGNIVAFVFGDPLSAPESADHKNKILWVVRDSTGADVNITARLAGHQPVQTRVPAGPSYLTMPTPGCWQLSLRIGSRQDTMNLRWNRP